MLSTIQFRTFFLVCSLKTENIKICKNIILPIVLYGCKHRGRKRWEAGEDRIMKSFIIFEVFMAVKTECVVCLGCCAA